MEKTEKRMELRLRELEHLAESLAHDLKAPGERIQELAALLRKEYASRLDERGNRWLELLEHNGKDLVGRVNGLLDIAGVGVPEKALEAVDPGPILHEVLEAWAGEVGSRRAQVRVEDEFQLVACHAAAVRQIFDNLISNAIKFSGDRPDFKIRITSERNDGQMCIRVADNGTGIPAPQRERVFEPFVRLNPGASGSGIGLAIVKRLVESYGGRTWIEANQEGGCTVHFLLPLIENLSEPKGSSK